MKWSGIQIGIPQNQKDSVMQFFDRLQPRPDSTLNLMRKLVEQMRMRGWRYTTNAGTLPNAINTRKINCDNLTDLIIFFCAYNNRDNNINAAQIHVHGVNSPVFIPQARITRTGLKIDMNVHGQLTGVFFSSGHRVARVNGVCFDLITGNKGPQANMQSAYVLCTRMPAPPNPPGSFQFNYLGRNYILTLQRGFTSQGLKKYNCT